MKTTSTILGCITVFFLLIGTLFKMQHWPGAGFALVFGLG
jgi:hypothetical protein